MVSSFTLTYPKKKDTLEKKKKETVVIRLTVQKRRWISLLLKSREDILSVCAISCHFASGGVTLLAVFKMFWRGLGMLAQSTGKQLIKQVSANKKNNIISISWNIYCMWAVWRVARALFQRLNQFILVRQVGINHKSPGYVPDF